MTPHPDRPSSEVPTLLPASGSAGVSVAGLLALLRHDQRLRWKRGERPHVEDYLQRHPTLRADADAVLDLAYAEFVLREEAGEVPAEAEYLARFPEHAEALRRQFDLHRALAQGATPPPSEAATLAPMPAGDVVVPETRAPAAGERSGDAGEAPGGVTVPGYAVLGLLGKGGMGVVYKARQVALGRTVALKMILHAEHAGDDERRRFHAEAEAVASLQHSNIVQIHEVGEHQGLPYFSLEFCGGGSLEKQLDGTPWEARRAAALVETLARAMHAAHRKGLIHRDLKPQNVLLSEDGTPKITDFGLAKKIDVQGHTQTGAVVGTPSYMAPEQAGGRKDIGPAADVYALGAILYELLTGRPPFRAATVLDTVLQVIADEPVPVRRLQPKVPRDLETICLKCLEKDPKKRYADAEALAEDLRRFGAGEPVAARPVGLPGRTARWARRRRCSRPSCSCSRPGSRCPPFSD